ncbi:MAG TPA: metallopeptidase TldD-related protein [Bacilli bacterium]|nr:metallopeptidase TldD-related protein [Bacilli bacterium]
MVLTHKSVITVSMLMFICLLLMAMQNKMIEKTKEGLLITDRAELRARLNLISGYFSTQSSGYLIKDKNISLLISLDDVFIKILKMIKKEN